MHLQPERKLGSTGLALVAIAIIQQWWLSDLGLEGTVASLYYAQWVGFKQVGLICVLTACVITIWRRIHSASWAQISPWLPGIALRILLSLLICFFTGEIALRALFSNGASFSSHGGPIVRRFERDFKLNGKLLNSRGPSLDPDFPTGRPRILVQGDSITWGQGVREESSLYTTRLLEAIANSGLQDASMAVLAGCGWEMDSHASTIREFSSRINPDVIVYQWYINDCEVGSKHQRPSGPMPWRRFFAHPILIQNSYIWFFLDANLANLVHPGALAHRDYLYRELLKDTESWQRFESSFRDWARTAKTQTTRVLVVLYPHMTADEFGYEKIQRRVEALCRSESIATLDLRKVFTDYRDRPKKLSVSPFDGHPNETAHGMIADALYDKIRHTWPDLWRRSPIGIKDHDTSL